MAELYSIESCGLEGRQRNRISVYYTAAMWRRSTETLSSCLMATTTCLQRTWHTRGEQQGKPEQLSPSQRTWKSHWRRTISSLTLRTSNCSSTCWVVFFRRTTAQPVMLKATPMFWLSRQPQNLLEKGILSLWEIILIYLYCCASTPVQIASAFISSQSQRQTPEDQFGTRK